MLKKPALIFLLVIFSAISSSLGAGSEKEKKIIADRSKQIISKIRQGDFSHIGGLKALSIMLSEIGEVDHRIREGNVLELGCGFGGSANFIHQSGYDNLWGIDIKPDTINYASSKYPEINFKAADILDITDEFDANFFSFVYSINTVSSISDQNNLWQEIKNICKQGAILALVDYTIPTRNELPVMLKPDEKVKYPIPLDDTRRIMQYIGWEIITEKDVTYDFKQWHLQMINEIKKRADLLMSAGFSEDEIHYVIDYYTNIIALMDEKKINGTIIIARKA